jgi:hypothetical protein
VRFLYPLVFKNRIRCWGSLDRMGTTKPEQLDAGATAFGEKEKGLIFMKPCVSLSRPVGTIFEPFFRGFKKVGIKKWKRTILIYNHLFA